jgi:hypothetical protein
MTRWLRLIALSRLAQRLNKAMSTYQKLLLLLGGEVGPSHLLELADKLGLSADQRFRVRQLFDSMKQEAIPLGSKLIERESELDQQFISRVVTAESLKTAIAEIAATQGALRETHLKYHLSTAAILTENQMQRYAELRGYGVHDPSSMQHRH